MGLLEAADESRGIMTIWRYRVPPAVHAAWCAWCAGSLCARCEGDGELAASANPDDGAPACPGCGGTGKRQRLTKAQRQALEDGARPARGLVSGAGRVCAAKQTIRRLTDMGYLLLQDRSSLSEQATGWLSRAGYAAIGIAPTGWQDKHPFMPGEPLP